MRKIIVDHDHELMSFEVRHELIQFRFGSLFADFSSAIEIIQPGPEPRIDVIESVWDSKGDLNTLWPLIGKRMTKLIMDSDSCRILFEDGTIVRRKYELATELVVVWGPGGDEITPYPSSIDCPGPGEKRYTGEEMLQIIFRDPFKPKE
jgi:hypothetical protein